MPARLKIVPIAIAYIKQHHRHHGPVVGYKYTVAVATEAERRVTFDPSILLPDNSERQPYWYYEGSLTTPEFDEAVSWAVMPPIKMKKLYIEKLGQLRHIEKPARQLQPLHCRFVIVNEPSAGATSASEGPANTQKGMARKSGRKQV